MVRFPEDDPLRKLGLSASKLADISKMLRTNEAIRSKLFPTVTELQPLVRPLDEKLLKNYAPKLIGTELQERFGENQAQLLVRTIGASTALTASRLVPSPNLQLATDRISQLFRHQGGIAGLSERWHKPLFDFANGMTRFIAEQQELDHQTNEFVQKHGWPVPLHLPLRAYRRVVAMASAGKRQVNRLMQEAFQPGTRPFARTTEVLLESPQFESRRPVLRQAIAAHRKGQWYLVINGLLPLVEGVLVDYAYAANTPPQSGRTEKALKRLRKREDASVGVAIDTLETLLTAAGANMAWFAGFDPKNYNAPGEPRSLNRNAILHGAARRYGSQQNALRLMLLLAVMAEGFDLAESI